MTTPDTDLLKVAVDSALRGVGYVMMEDGSVSSDLSKVDEFERQLRRAHAALVEYQCQARGLSRK